MKTELTILILGGNIMQLPAIRIAKEMGWQVIVADANPAVPGAELADFFEVVDLKDREGMLRMASGFAARGMLDGVFTAGTDFSTTVAFVAEELKLPGIPYRVAVQATDKARMRAAFRNAGVPCPGFISLKQGDNPEHALSQLTFPLVVKPVDNMGARGIRRVDSMDQLKKAFLAALAASRSGQVILEEFLPGAEYSIDALVENGNIHICGVADRHIFFPPYFVEMGHTIPAALEPGQHRELIRVFKKGIQALGITLGAAKGDIFITPRGVMIGEIAARLSGGYMSGWTYPYASGIQPVKQALRLAVGLPLDLALQEKPDTSAERAFLSIPGQITGITGLDTARDGAGVKDVFCLVRPGQEVRFPTNNVEKCGNIIACAETRTMAITAAEEARKKIKIYLHPCHPVTSAYLFASSSGGGALHPAFSLKVDSNIEEYERMPLYKKNSGNTKTLCILTLPELEKEKARDWYGVELSDAFCQLKRDFPALIVSGVPPEPALVLGKIFWRAFLVGGYQGGHFILNSCHVLSDPEREIEIKKWIELFQYESKANGGKV